MQKGSPCTFPILVVGLAGVQVLAEQRGEVDDNVVSCRVLEDAQNLDMLKAFPFHFSFDLCYKEDFFDYRSKRPDTKLVSPSHLRKDIDAFFHAQFVPYKLRQHIVSKCLEEFQLFLSGKGQSPLEKFSTNFNNMSYEQWENLYESNSNSLANAESSLEDSEFLIAFRRLLLSPSTSSLEALYKMESIFYRELHAERVNMKMALNKLDTIHLLEMEQYERNSTLRPSESVQELLSDIVDKHVAETELTERHWSASLEDIRARQTEQIRSFILESRVTIREIPSVQKSPKSPIVSVISRSVLLGDDHRKRFLNLRVLDSDYTQICSCDYSSKAEGIRKSCLQYLFSDQLCGLVIPHHSSSAPIVSQFITDCESLGEYVFPDVHQQIANIQLQEKKLSFGDVFVTKHSNLLSIHCAFHIVCGRSKQEDAGDDGTDSILEGLEQVIKRAGKLGVESIFIPLSFTSNQFTSERQLSRDLEQECTRIMRVVKKSIVEDIQTDISKQQDSSLKQINFFIPMNKDSDSTLSTFYNILDDIFPESFPQKIDSHP